MTELEFRRIHWPRKFTVDYRDGRSEVLAGEDGVMFSGPEDDPLNRGHISAKIQPKSRRTPRANIAWRGCYLDEIRSIVTPTRRSPVVSPFVTDKGMGRMTAAWILLIAGVLAAAATAYFIALAVVTGPAHGPFIEVVFVGVAVSLLLVVAPVRIRRRASVKHQ